MVWVGKQDSQSGVCHVYQSLELYLKKSIIQEKKYNQTTGMGNPLALDGDAEEGQPKNEEH